MPILRRRCPEGHTYELLESQGTLSALDHDDIDNLDCPTCGATEAVVVIGGASGIGLGGQGGVGKFYPRYDRGLGCMVDSEQHRRQLCKERNLIPTEGDDRGTWREIAEAERHDIAEDARAYNEYETEMREGPNRAAYHQLREHLKRQGVQR